MNWNSERGAALLSVLLLVAVMSVAALAMLELTVQSVQRSKAVDQRSDIAWQVTGAEELGFVAVERLRVATNGQLNDRSEGLGEPVVFELGTGFIEAELREASNCFNLNSLRGSGGEDDDGNDARALYRHLLGALNFGEAEIEELSDSLIDWLDADNTPRLSGAEDSFYTVQRPAYRSAGTWLANVSELRAISGYTQAVAAQLGSLVCVRPGVEAMRLNINTLTPRQAPLLAVAFSGELNANEAIDLLALRPIGGWETVEIMMDAERIQEISFDLRRSDLMTLTSQYLVLNGRTGRGDVEGAFRTYYAFSEGEPVRIFRREYGAL